MNSDALGPLDLSDPVSISDATLQDALIVLQAEQARRSLERADVPALIEDGFNRGFDANGEALDPWVRDGILVAPGVKTDRSASSHVCAFVRVGNHWVWEAPDRVEDVVRSSAGTRQQMRSVTLVAIAEGVGVDRIQSKARTGSHELSGVRSFVVREGKLELVSARAVKGMSHR